MKYLGNYSIFLSYFLFYFSYLKYNKGANYKRTLNDGKLLHLTVEESSLIKEGG